MSTRPLMKLCLVSALSLILSTAATAEDKKPAAKPAAKKPAAVLTAAGDIKWADVPGFAGVMIAPVQGNPEKGSAHFFLKLPAGFKAPLHHHSSDHYGTVVSGTMTLTPEGGQAKKLPAGSFFSFMGAKIHTTDCDAGADCVLMVDCRGKWDIVPEEAKK